MAGRHFAADTPELRAQWGGFAWDDVAQAEVRPGIGLVTTNRCQRFNFNPIAAWRCVRKYAVAIPAIPAPQITTSALSLFCLIHVSFFV